MPKSSSFAGGVPVLIEGTLENNFKATAAQLGSSDYAKNQRR
jgi:hypothetical protein